MVDVKKLIAGFLILATGISSSVLIFSYLNSPHATNIATNSNPSSIGGNAFVPQPSSGSTESALTPDITNNPENLTGNLTGTLLNGIMSANPRGPATDSSGNPTMTPPDQAKMIAQLSNNATFKNFKAPDWDAEADAIPLNITKDYSPQDVVAYVKTVSDAINNNFIQSGAQDSLSHALSDSNNATGDLDPSLINTVAPLTAAALTDVAGLKTPASFSGFQKGLVRLLVYEKNIAKLTGGSPEDPVKVSLIIESEQNGFNLAEKNLQNELKKVIKGGIFSLENSKTSQGPIATLIGFLGIKTADAQGVTVPTFDASVETAITSVESTQVADQATNYGEILAQLALKLALQIVKNSLIKFIQNKMLAWIQGSGAPRFVTNWADTFVNVATAKAVSTLNSITPNICPSFGPLINASLKVSLGGGVALPSNGFNTCTMSTANMKSFYNDFSNGSWKSYFTMLQSNNNFYAQLMVTEDARDAAAAAAAAANRAKLVAGQGYTGDQACADGSDPNGSSKACIAPDGTEYYPHSDGTCDAGETLQTTPNNGLCADGSEPETTTPGEMTAAASAKVLGSSVDLVVNAQDVESIAVSLTESLLTKLFDSAQTKINGFLNNNNGGVLHVQPVPDNVTATSHSISCSPATQTISLGTGVALLYAAGGAYDTNSNPPTYAWGASGANPASSTGFAFSGTYSAEGNYNVTVTASTDSTTATCQVVVIKPSTTTLVSCSPATQTVSVGSPASLSATDSNSYATYVWTSPGATSQNFTGSTFNATYSSAGTYNVTVTATDNTSSTCQVTVQ